MDHYIKEKLHIKYYVRYQDNFLLMHHDKEYLKYCLIKIQDFLIQDKLLLNNKTRLHKNTDNFIFSEKLNIKNIYIKIILLILILILVVLIHIKIILI